MRSSALAVLVACLILPLVGLGVVIELTPSVSARMLADGTCEVRVRVDGVEQWQAMPPDFCTFPPTAVPPTHTPHPSPAPESAGWHAPTTHEHGDEPPAWVLTSGHPPFTQSRESHTGYKGVYDVSPGGAESYLITHILSTVFARSHGDHDYQLWLRSPLTGEVIYREGILDFGNPPPLRTTDTGQRPIILSVGDGACETWYSRPGAMLSDIGWTMCGRYEDFAGNVDGGVGTFRTMDWLIPCDRLPAASTLRQHCRVEFGLSRLSFLVNDREYRVPGVVPIN